MTLSLTDYGTVYNYYDYLYYTVEDLYELSHPKRGDIKVELISPDGTVSTLLPYRKYDYINDVGYSNWPFMTVHHWGENPVGTWQLKVYFQSNSGEIDVTINAVDFYGYGNDNITPTRVHTVVTPTHSSSDINDTPSDSGKGSSTVTILASIGATVFVLIVLAIAIGGGICSYRIIKKKTSHTVAYSMMSQTPVDV